MSLIQSVGIEIAMEIIRTHPTIGRFWLSDVRAPAYFWMCLMCSESDINDCIPVFVLV